MLERETKSVPLFSAPQETVGKKDVSDHLGDEDGCMMKRFQSTDVTNQLNLLNEPSPLGLNLRKSPSLLDLIQRRLSHNEDEGGDVCDKGGKIDKPGNSSSSDKDKLKAANFPAVKLRVGTWEVKTVSYVVLSSLMRIPWRLKTFDSFVLPYLSLMRIPWRLRTFYSFCVSISLILFL